MTPEEIRRIRNLPLYYLPVINGQHQFYAFRNYYGRKFNVDGSYQHRPGEKPAEGFDANFVPQWPNCGQRCQGMMHDKEQNLHILCMCRHQDSEHFTKVVKVEQCQTCPLKGVHHGG